MRILKLMPADFEMTLMECPPGHFLFDGQHVGFKSEYRTEAGKIEAYNEAGEFFCGGEDKKVMPLFPEWVDE